MASINPICRWRQYKHLHRLEGCQCVNCNQLYFPKCYLCSCESKNFIPYTFNGTGTLLSFTRIFSPSKRYEHAAPYIIGIIKLDEGVMITAQIAQATLHELIIGMPLKKCFRKLYQEGSTGTIQYGFKFIPVFNESSTNEEGDRL